MKLTRREKQEIAKEVYRDEPLPIIGHLTLLKMGQLAVETGAKDATLSTEASFKGKRYALRMVVSYEELK